MFEPEAIELIGQEGARLLTTIVRDAWDELHNQPLGLLARTRRQDMSDLMIQHANRRLLVHAQIELHVKDTIYWYVWDEIAAIRFKHHGRSGLTSNQSSGAQTVIAEQGTLPGLPQGLVYLSCGATLDRTETEITQVLLTKRSGRLNEWALDLDRLADGDFGPQTSPLPIVPNNSPTVGKIIPLRHSNGES
ncbi:MAG: hypothetical protein HIU84_12815 [Acidobacteria bacterium]|nr:hypothetical protein [Acidobacteriota bacterium]